ncbi:anhydro-N-acetylmuramic acid kinase [Kaistella jeonii]|uniref:Anhydro-N-acetylmuramic acid kinase n=1 Tax=Kaistella jeonii TaxID=266749 RepID=A0A0C1FR43_9FLAO|nr:anhydro-N-acetylmuramic acid kinase [Kaistella jeonii]KIA90364.1 anhydro-N-acetylmuramic acid kinase [Kaistella jeonii]SFB73931.1 anhydro-N-acetylmuramic acid kinase [Kaistella jeonii]VEI95087.1 Anhydro-N-acetylmuramic acid kinase [Kaistella jeonii]
MEFYAIGLMSGSSLDGLDICYAKFQKENNTWKYEILKAETISYSQHWEGKLRNSINLNSEELLALNSEYGFYLGKRVQEFIGQFSLKNVDIIASHGHTVFHQPQNKFTLQIGDGRAIKILTQIPVVYDFRSQDVLMGGSGAPLVPIGDELLFSEFDACLNIGGFSNISFRKEGKRVAFDICPVNIIMNQFAKKLGKYFDENGDLARNGTVNFEILSLLNSLPFYESSAPKSLGIEWINENISPLLEGEIAENVLATFTEHAAFQIAEIFNQYEIQKVLFTGGGTYNSYLIERIKNKTSAEIIIPEKELIDFKEALIFAFMGVLRMNNEINILSSATGSSADHCSGLLI